ncbi:hypothetical protein BTO06_12135 [Tenacibaculum sp. SZ-18]|uniref:hypothetical protein n=1 Tax=Tenacibaculum sp. SZ-18 TaxID=754423 RepID=UPI000C2D1913|nr:hypothetical protein [Tenacibaculum sp. SZ-18]AUC15765.1 hypothetical protein BTO06_11665 [Tenacibaculum sp. SZ-18]AUC15853.1 hypothetical protein BTO06_12135 [Tenacibaculum sp. SZ-18]
MKKILLTFFILSYSIISSGQSKIKGQLFDEYGNAAWAEIFINGEPTEWMSYNGIINLVCTENGINEITFKYFGHYITKIKVECNDDIVDLGEIYLISGNFWLDGPKNGFISDNYKNGKVKYKINIKRWKPHGDSKFYNSKGELTQRLIYKKGKLLKIYIRENGKLNELKFEITKKGEILTVPNKV